MRFNYFKILSSLLVSLQHLCNLLAKIWTYILKMITPTIYCKHNEQFLYKIWKLDLHVELNKNSRTIYQYLRHGGRAVAALSYKQVFLKNVIKMAKKLHHECWTIFQLRLWTLRTKVCYSLLKCFSSINFLLFFLVYCNAFNFFRYKSLVAAKHI